MSLVPFHRGLISAAIVFCAGFAAWAFLDYRGDGGLAALLLSATFAVLAIGLAVYLWNLRRILRLPDAAARDAGDPARH